MKNLPVSLAGNSIRELEAPLRILFIPEGYQEERLHQDSAARCQENMQANQDGTQRSLVKEEAQIVDNGNMKER